MMFCYFLGVLILGLGLNVVEGRYTEINTAHNDIFTKFADGYKGE